MSNTSEEGTLTKGGKKYSSIETEIGTIDGLKNEVNYKAGLKVLLITQGITRLVEPLLKSRHQVIGVLESAPRQQENRSTLNSLLVIPRLVYSKLRSRELSLEEKAEIEGIPYRLMASSDEPGLVEWVQKLKPDIIVVFSMSQLLSEKVFSIPDFGAINLHPSFLPEYRGPNPDFWQYYNMEMNPGITVHYIDKGEDTGDIIFQERTHIPLGTKSPVRLNGLVGENGVTIVLKALDAIQTGTSPRIKQPAKSPTAKARHLKAAEHKTIIDWHNWPIERIWHVLRGTEQWLDALPQPKSMWTGHRWMIDEFEKRVTDSTEIGEVAKKNGRYCVTCRDGYIYLSRKFNLKILIMSLLRR
tara:strand:- start:14507 stop:15577 length:1071 start_codon:yes stop_codon:yes gene_type:complete